MYLSGWVSSHNFIHNEWIYIVMKNKTEYDTTVNWGWNISEQYLASNIINDISARPNGIHTNIEQWAPINDLLHTQEHTRPAQNNFTHMWVVFRNIHMLALYLAI